MWIRFVQSDRGGPAVCDARQCGAEDTGSEVATNGHAFRDDVGHRFSLSMVEDASCLQPALSLPLCRTPRLARRNCPWLGSRGRAPPGLIETRRVLWGRSASARFPLGGRLVIWRFALPVWGRGPGGCVTPSPRIHALFRKQAMAAVCSPQTHRSHPVRRLFPHPPHRLGVGRLHCVGGRMAVSRSFGVSDRAGEASFHSARSGGKDRVRLSTSAGTAP